MHFVRLSFAALALTLTLAAARPFLSGNRPRDDEYAAESTFHPASEAAKVYQVGSDIPGVGFKTQPSWAGLVPIAKDADLSIDRLKNLPKEQPQALFFWLWGAEEGGSTKDLVIWLNGGPGCSSQVGNLKEMGPMDASDLKAGIKLRPDRWTKDANILFVDQPVGAGLSSGDPSITNEDELAEQFYDFYTNLVEIFPELSKMTLSIAAESYGGLFGPYISRYFLKQSETYNLAGLITIDGLIARQPVQDDLVYYDLAKKYQKLLNVTDEDLRGIKEAATERGYYGYVDKYLKYPPEGPLPSIKYDLYVGGVRDHYKLACFTGNPNFGFYDIRDRSEAGTSISDFLSVQAVQDYIHAPHVDFQICDNRPVFPNGGDKSGPVNEGVLTSVIEDKRMKQVIVAQGIYDGLVVDIGTEVGLANMTWRGKQGFSNAPAASVFVGYDGKPAGHFTEDRGLAYVAVDDAGHMIPANNPVAGRTLLQVLLGQRTLDGTEVNGSKNGTS